jgi:hypothetical protein
MKVELTRITCNILYILACNVETCSVITLLYERRRGEIYKKKRETKRRKRRETMINKQQNPGTQDAVLYFKSIKF